MAGRSMAENRWVTDARADVPPLTPTATVAKALVDNVSAVVLGKRQEVVLVVAGLLSGGHVLLEDVPGVGKTMLARSLARSIGGSMARIQGTTDLMPSDITGVNVYDPGNHSWDFHPGPVFNNVVLLDEVNRATPRSQSALLEAMSEGQVTIDGVGRLLPRPFFVVATQNPYGDVGTFPLSEGQSDRFALIVSLGLPDREAERAVLRGDGGPAALEALEPVVSGADLAAAIADVDRTHVDPAVADYVLDIVDATRSHPDLDHGASPRAAHTFLQVAKAHAVLAGRDFVSPDDVKAVAVAVLAHRLGVLSRRGTDATRRLVTDLLGAVAAPTA